MSFVILFMISYNPASYRVTCLLTIIPQTLNSTGNINLIHNWVVINILNFIAFSFKVYHLFFFFLLLLLNYGIYCESIYSLFNYDRRCICRAYYFRIVLLIGPWKGFISGKLFFFSLLFFFLSYFLLELITIISPLGAGRWLTVGGPAYAASALQHLATPHRHLLTKSGNQV